MKKCTTCGIEKPLTEFGRNALSRGGLNSQCKECVKATRRRRVLKNMNDPEWIEHSREMRRLRYYRNKNAELKERVDYRSLYPERTIANTEAHRKLADKPGMIKHHWSYLKEHRLDVIYINKVHHGIAHKYIIYDPERMMYRGLDGVLLDSKNEHEKYINDVLIKYGYVK